MNEVEVYGKLIERFILRMTSPEIGQFKMEVSTFRMMLDRARDDEPALVKFTITDSGKVVNNLGDDDRAISALTNLFQRSMVFISSLMGDEMAQDIINTSMLEDIEKLGPLLKGKKRIQEQVPQPFNYLINKILEKEGKGTDHDEIIELFEEIFQAYLKELSAHTDLSAFKLKLSILREKYELLKYVSINEEPAIIIENDKWSSATEEEVSSSLAALFNSLVGLSIFLVGKEEAFRKATKIFLYYFKGKEDVLHRYDVLDDILDGSLHKKVPTGLEVLDRGMGGGISKGASILLISPSGIERDMFISNLLKRGLNNGSSALWVLSKEPPRSVRMLLRSNDLDPEDLEDKGRLRIVDWFSWRGERIIGVERDGHALRSSKILSNLGIAINKGLRELAYSTSKIGIVHMIGPATNLFDFNQVYNFVQRLRAKFKDNEMAAIFLLETDTVSKDLQSRLLEVFDGTLEIEKKMDGGNFRREIRINSLSGVDFDANPVPFEIRDNMIIPGADLEEEFIVTVGQSDDETEEFDEDERRADKEEVDDDKFLKIKSIRKGGTRIEKERQKGPSKQKPKPKRVRRIKKEIRTGPDMRSNGPSDRIIGNQRVDKSSKPDEGTRTKKKVKRIIKRVKVKSNKVDDDGLDLGTDESSSKDILQNAINTIDLLLEGDGVPVKDTNRKRIK